MDDTKQHRVSLCVNIRVLVPTITLPPQALERFGPFAGPRAFGFDVPQRAWRAQNRRYVQRDACNHSRSKVHVHKMSFGESPTENWVCVVHQSPMVTVDGYWMFECWSEYRRTEVGHPTRCCRKCHVSANAELSYFPIFKKQDSSQVKPQ